MHMILYNSIVKNDFCKNQYYYCYLSQAFTFSKFTKDDNE